MISEKTIEQLRKEHRCFSNLNTPCCFFGFNDSKELEDKLYDFIDSSGDEWNYADDA